MDNYIRMWNVLVVALDPTLLANACPSLGRTKYVELNMEPLHNVRILRIQAVVFPFKTNMYVIPRFNHGLVRNQWGLLLELLLDSNVKSQRMFFLQILV